MISKLIYGKESSWTDPVKYTFAHGGKDRVPYPVDRKTYDESIRTLKEILDKAEIDRKEKLKALKKLAELDI